MYNAAFTLKTAAGEKKKHADKDDANGNQKEEPKVKSLADIAKEKTDIAYAPNVAFGLEEAKQDMKELRGNVASSKKAVNDYDEAYDKQ